MMDDDNQQVFARKLDMLVSDALVGLELPQIIAVLEAKSETLKMLLPEIGPL